MTLLKRYVSSMPESLFGGETTFSAWIAVGSTRSECGVFFGVLIVSTDIHEEAVRVERIQSALGLLTDLQRHALHIVFHLLHLVVLQADKNKV